MLTNLKDLLKDCKGGVASFNTVEIDMTKSCIRAAEEKQRPVIIGVATRHWENIDIETTIPALIKICDDSSVPTALHLDHAKPTELDKVNKALDLGFTSIMIDGSKLSLNKNIDITKQVVKRASKYGASVEAELGPLQGTEGVADVVDLNKETIYYTDPKEALHFYNQTGVDALAVAVGTAHGVYKNKPNIQLDLISRLAEIIPTPLVMHGATGIPEDSIKESVRRGIRKINYFSGFLISAMDIIRNFDDQNDNDYLALRHKITEKWKQLASEMIELYR